jgi:hypothetical protein
VRTSVVYEEYEESLFKSLRSMLVQAIGSAQNIATSINHIDAENFL